MVNMINSCVLLLCLVGRYISTSCVVTYYYNHWLLQNNDLQLKALISAIPCLVVCSHTKASFQHLLVRLL